MKHLDERMRARFRAAAEGEQVAVRETSAVGDSSAMGHTDLAAIMADQGPGLVRRAHRARTVRRAATATAAVLVPLLALVGWRLWQSDVAESGAVATAACASRAVQGTVGPIERPTDWGFAAFEAEAGSRLSVETAGPCETRLVLAEGAVRVHARDLAGGELTVVTPDGEVTVLGTVFRVEADADRWGVEVAEGRVRVRRGGQPVAVVDGGERWRSGEATTDLETSTQQALLDWTDERSSSDETVASSVTTSQADETTGPDTQSPASSSARRTVEELVREAELAHRRGELNRARALFQRAGARSGPTAEGAWIRLARLELNRGHATAALRALRERSRFGRGFFGAEAAWIEVQARSEEGDRAGARRAARRLARRYQGTPQSEAAARWLEGSR